MTDEPKNDPRSRMRAMLGASPRNGGETIQDGTMTDAKSSPLSRLPKRAAPAAVAKDAEIPPPPPAPVEEKAPAPLKLKGVPAAKSRRYSFGPAFWTITGTLSLIVNVVLFIALVLLYRNLPTLNVGGVMNLPTGLLSGLYTNFEKMDRAHIRTNVVVNTTIPVKFDLPLNQQTNVVLSQDVRIDNARVTVNTGGLNITNALTAIVLPAGTNLPVVLNLTVPVDQSVPVTLNVPVDIALSQTDLHEPFVGLQQVIQPLYCMVVPTATNLDGQIICNPTQ